jgi:hypothetical protein
MGALKVFLFFSVALWAGAIRDYLLPLQPVLAA